jgi:hypothetical protein
MNEFRPERDDLWGTACISYQVQFVLSPVAKIALADLSSALTRNARDGLWVQPADSLHVTCYSLVSPRETYDKCRYWEKVAGPADTCMRLMEAEVSGFTLCFDNLRVTNRAIIALAAEVPMVAQARSIFARSIPQPPVAVGPPTTTHVTLCRYRNPASIDPDLPRRASHILSSISTDIREAVLVRELTYPSLRCEIINSAALHMPT